MLYVKDKDVLYSTWKSAQCYSPAWMAGAFGGEWIHVYPKVCPFAVQCWRRLLRVPWTARRSNQSILKDISPGISLEGMMLKLKLQCFGHLMWRVDSLEKTLMLGGIGGRRRRGRQRMRTQTTDGWHHRLDGLESEWTPGVGDGQGGLGCWDSWGLKESDTTERLNWTELSNHWLKKMDQVSLQLIAWSQAQVNCSINQSCQVTCKKNKHLFF